MHRRCHSLFRMNPAYLQVMIGNFVRVAERWIEEFDIRKGV